MSQPTVTHGKAVAFTYVLRGDDGDVIDASGDRAMTYLHGYGGIIPGLERALEGHKLGDAVDAVIPPEEAYGLPSPDANQKVHRSQFPPGAEIEVGMAFQAHSAEGHTIQVFVTEMVGAYVTLTTNHPLAGKTLHFATKIVDIRDASAEELAHGHVHGPGGHHH